MKILFITATRIGDAVLSTGILGALIDRHPGAHISVACGPAASPLFAEAPRVERVIEMAKRKRAGHWIDLWKACISTHWDLIVDLRNSPMPYFLRSRERFVMRNVGGDMHGDRHKVERLATVLDLDPPPEPQLWLSQDHLDAARKLIPASRPFLALGPTANWPGKEWQGIRFAELAQRLTSSDGILAGAGVAILGAETERAAAGDVLRLIPKAQRLDLVGKLDLLTVFAVLRRCRMFIGNDSGLMHMAAASGIPTVGLFGPSREQNYAPWGARTATVRTEMTYDELINAPGYDHRTTGSLMNSLSIDDVEETAIQLWRRCGEEAA